MNAKVDRLSKKRTDCPVSPKFKIRLLVTCPICLYLAYAYELLPQEYIWFSRKRDLGLRGFSGQLLQFLDSNVIEQNLTLLAGMDLQGKEAL